MRNSYTGVLEKNTVLSGEYATEPYEVAWAGEARWFLQVIERTGSPEITAVTQISPDGLTWLDLDDQAVRLDEQQAVASWSARDFGHWLRIRGTVTGGSAKVRIYLALKE